MSGHVRHSGQLRERALDEVKAFAALSLYLYVCLGAVILYKRAVLSAVGVEFEIWGIAAVKAMIMAKFMLVARMLRVERQYRHKPLIWPTCYHALTFLVVLLALTMVEELVVGTIHHRAVIDSLGHVAGTSVLMIASTCIIMFLVIVPYSAFICLADAFGERQVFRLFFTDRAAGGDLRDRLAERLPAAE